MSFTSFCIFRCCLPPFNNSFIEIRSTYHKIHPFKTHNLGVGFCFFWVYSRLCCPNSKDVFIAPSARTPYPPLLQDPGHTDAPLSLPRRGVSLGHLTSMGSCNLSWQASFAQYNIFKVYPSCSCHKHSMLFYCGIISPWMDITHFICPFIIWWTFGLFSHFTVDIMNDACVFL